MREIYKQQIESAKAASQMTRFCFGRNLRSAECNPMSFADLMTIVESRHVRLTLAEIQRQQSQLQHAGDEAEEKSITDQIAQLKQTLPYFCFHVQQFCDNKRGNRHVLEASGMAMLDVDHIDDPEALLARADGHEQEWGLALSYKTPSGHGARFVFTLNAEQHETIEQAQQRFATLLGITQYDGVCKDMARVSFAVSLDYFHYLDVAMITRTDHTSTQVPVPVPVPVPNDVPINVPVPVSAPASSEQTDYKGIPLEEIVQKLLLKLGCIEGPAEGERNQTYFTLCTQLRYLVDFSQQRLLRVLPDFGLPHDERAATAQSALNRPRRGQFPALLQQALALCEVERESMLTDDIQESLDPQALPVPKAPGILRIFLRHLPPAYHGAFLIASLPVVGMMPRCQFRYLDNGMHDVGAWLSILVAPSGAGKSLITRDPMRLLLKPIAEADLKQELVMEEYKEKKQCLGANDQKPRPPHTYTRINGYGVTNACILQLLKDSQRDVPRQTILMMEEEIDTALKAEQGGLNYKHLDVMRLSFDRADYVLRRVSDSSVSGSAPAYINCLMTGTHRALHRFLPDDDVEGGTCGRFAFASLPDTFGQPMPYVKPYTEAEQQEIELAVRRLMDQSGELEMTRSLRKAVEEFLEEKRAMAIQSDSRAIDTLRRRCGVMMARAAMLPSLLEGKMNRLCIDFGRFVAEYVFRQQMVLFGEQFEQAAEESQKRRGGGKVKNLFFDMPDVFSRMDLIKARIERHQSADNVKVILCRWKADGYIEEIGADSYRKLKRECA